MKVKLDCPLCSVTMRQVGQFTKKGEPMFFICPICESMFSPYKAPEKQKWIRERMKEKGV
jgi:transposase-like protein